MAGPFGAPWQVEVRSQALHALGQGRGVWERVFEALTKDRDNAYLMLDSTIVRAHQQAATGKRGPGTRLWGVPEVD